MAVQVQDVMAVLAQEPKVQDGIEEVRICPGSAENHTLAVAKPHKETSALHQEPVAQTRGLAIEHGACACYSAYCAGPFHPSHALLPFLSIACSLSLQ